MQNPNIVAELKRIARANNGELRPVDVVAAAKPEDSPLHDEFVWNDSEAGQRYRIWQARVLIRVTVQYVGPEENTQPARVFVSLTPDRQKDGGGYRVIGAVMANAEHRKQLLADALAEMTRFEQKYSALQELVEIFAAMRKLAAKGKAA